MGENKQEINPVVLTKKMVAFKVLSLVLMGLCLVGIVAHIQSFEGGLIYWYGRYQSGVGSPLWLQIAPSSSFVLPLAALVYTAFRAYRLGKIAGS